MYNDYIIFYTHIYIYTYNIHMMSILNLYLHLHTSDFFSLTLHHAYRLDGQTKRYSSFNAEMLDRPRRGWQRKKPRKNTSRIVRECALPKWPEKSSGFRMYHKLALSSLTSHVHGHLRRGLKTPQLYRAQLTINQSPWF